MGAIGKTLDEIAKFLTKKYGVRYYVERGELWRESNPSPICVSRW